MRGSRERNPAVMVSGTVTSFDAGKGYGYVAQGGGLELFAEQRTLHNHDPRFLALGERVVIEVVQGPEGPHVGSVRKF